MRIQISESKTFFQEYKDNEANNAHTENVVLLADRYGTKRDVEAAKAILTLKERRGYLSHDDAELSYQIQKPLYQKMLKEFQ